MISSGDNEGIVAGCRHSCQQENQDPCLFSYVNQLLLIKLHHLLNYQRPKQLFLFVIIASRRSTE
jgi:hypothetical protein